MTEFWQRMDALLGAAYARSWAADQVLQPLGGRTVREALAAGEDTKRIWMAVCDVLDVPARHR